MFTSIEEAQAIIVERGVYRPAKVYAYRDLLFVQAKGGMVRVAADGGTSHPAVRLHALHYDGELFKDRFGRVCIAAGEGRSRLLVMDSGKFGVGA